MKYIIFGIIGLGALYFFFKTGNVDLAIDNPSDEALIVSVDELTVEVPAKELVWVEMGKGNHTITLPNGDTEDFNFTETAYMLNPTMSEYLVAEHFFGDMISQLGYMKNFAAKDSVEYMGFTLPGNYQVVKDLVNKVTWEIGARQAVPETIEADADENYVVIKKLNDPGEFWDMVMESLQSEGGEGE